MTGVLAGAASRARGRLVDSPDSYGARRRAARWELLRAYFPDIEALRVLDLGGTAESWRRAPVRPAHVTVLNLFEPGESDDDWLLPVTGDAVHAREALAGAGVDTGFDLVYSNSLLEHVGGHAQRRGLADEVRALAPRYWVQTPYRYFPVEPHWLFPGLQFLPLPLRVKAAQRWPLGWSQPEGRDNVAHVLSVELLTRTEMHFLFPDSEIAEERAAGLCKSLIALQR